MHCLLTASLAHVPFVFVANQISLFNSPRSGSSMTVNDSVLNSTMEAVRTGCSKGIFLLGRYLGDSDVLSQLVTNILVPAFQKWPKCASEITINYFLRRDRQRTRCALTVNYSLPNSRAPSPLPQQSGQALSCTPIYLSLQFLHLSI